MRKLSCLLVGVLSLTATLVDAQTGAVQRVTLEARRQTRSSDNYVIAAFSFEFGINGETGKRITRNDWDILFGNAPNSDTFDVTMVNDDCSRIVDLGPKEWSDTFPPPSLPPHPTPRREPAVDAIVGHMYLVHTKDRNSDVYAMFRVEALTPGQNVTISWKRLR